MLPLRNTITGANEGNEKDAVRNVGQGSAMTYVLSNGDRDGGIGDSELAA
jgi:hypothetical protein